MCRDRLRRAWAAANMLLLTQPLGYSRGLPDILVRVSSIGVLKFDTGVDAPPRCNKVFFGSEEARCCDGTCKFTNASFRGTDLLIIAEIGRR